MKIYSSLKSLKDKQTSFLQNSGGKKRLLFIVLLSLCSFALLLFAFLEWYPFSKPQTDHLKVIANAQFSGLHVSGNMLVNEQGQQVVLHGANRSGAEYSCIHGNGFMDGPADEPSVKAMANWHVNVVRLPFNEHCWLGLAGTDPGGETYQHEMKDYVALFEKYKIYVIL